MKAITAALLVGAAVLTAETGAQAYSNLEAYVDCLDAVSRNHVDKHGETESALTEATREADRICDDLRRAAIVDSSEEKVAEARSRAKARLHKTEYSETAEAASARPVREYNPSIVYALDNTVACRWMDDLSKHRNLMQAERPDQAVKLDCLDIPIGQKLIVLDDSLSDITLVLYEALGMRAELWIDDRYIAH